MDFSVNGKNVIKENLIRDGMTYYLKVSKC